MPTRLMSGGCAWTVGASEIDFLMQFQADLGAEVVRPL
jgi:glycerol kinase